MNSIENRFEQINQLISANLKSDVALINQLTNYIVMAGGKRLRPKLVLLTAKALGYDGKDDIKLATIIEFIHTATLLHDDVVDESKIRRGRDTANEVFGNQAAVLTGDFLYSRSFQMMVAIDNMQVMKILSDTTNVIAEGEVMQLMHSYQPDISEEQYLEIIYRKTARLFESATELGAVIADNSNKQHITIFANYGKHLGNAFQIIDDVIDYSSQSADMGKNSGDDLAEGKVTLPLIKAMQFGSKSEKKLIVDAVRNASTENLSKIVKIINSSGAFDYCLKLAQDEVKQAVAELDKVENSVHKSELINIAKSSVTRKS